MALSTRTTAARSLQSSRVAGRCVAIPRPQLPKRLSTMTKATTDSNGGDKKALRREEEPEEYWVSKGERKGANPMSDPLAIIGVTAIFLPFVLLGIAIATGLVDISVYR